MFSQPRLSILENVRAHKWKGYSMSHVGTYRSLNEDAYFIDIGYFNQNSVVFAIVCDGLGGLEKGDLASAWIMTGLSNHWYKMLKRADLLAFDFESFAHSFERELINLHQQMFQYASDENRAMGTTCSLILLWKDRLKGFHVGDSRIYAYCKKLKKLTRDDSWVQIQMERGFLTEEEIMVHPKRHLITQCIGGQEHLSIEQIDLETKDISALFLCTDGLYTTCQTSDLIDCCKASKEGSTSLEELFEKILSAGAEDNLTAILVKKNKRAKWSFMR